MVPDPYKSNFAMASPQTIQMLKKLLIFVTPVKSCYIAAISIKLS